MSAAETTDYLSGSCNIGPAEITRRRRGGHLALGAAAAFAWAALALRLPRPARLLVFFPVYGAAIGYLQAASRFCAGFAMRGVYNFGPPGRVEMVPDPAARQRDRRRGMQLAARAALIAASVAAAFTRV